MKKLRYFLLGILLIPTTALAAGTATISGPSSIQNGSNVTISVTVRNTAAWNLKLSGSGATSGCSNTVADVTANGQNTTKTFSVTCKATSLGTIKFVVSGDITSADGTNSNVSLTKTVTVTKPREKESESRLSYLNVDGYNIEFNKDKKNYSIVVEPTIDSIKIDAGAISKYAIVNGAGVKEIKDEENKFVITCTSETGIKTEYVINVSVKDNNPINISIDGKEYTVYKTNKSLTAPLNYTETNIKIGDFDIPAYINETTGLTVVGVKDSDGNTKYAIYNNGNYTLYNENKSDGLLLYITEKNLDGYNKTTININDSQYVAYEISERYVLVYAMNINTGESGYYKYDKNEKTFQYFEINQVENSETDTNIFLITTIVLAITSLIATIYIVCSKINKKI